MDYGQKIDILAYKVESFDSDSFKENLVSYNPNSILLMFNQKRVWFAHKPLNCKMKVRFLSFSKLNNPRWNYYIYPILFIVDHCRVFKLLLSICLKQKPNVLLVENTYVAVIAGIIRKCNIVKNVIYIPGDWLAGNKVKGKMWSNIGNNIVFPFFDYWACKLSDITLNCTEYIAEARHQFWNKEISRKEMLYRPILKVKKDSTDIKSNKRKIVFIGNIREDSGLELVIKDLRTIRMDLDISLKIIGVYNDECRFLRKIAQKCQVERYVDFLGFVERADFEKVLLDCFCGINLLTIQDSYTTKTLPAKIFNYLQYLLPVIATENIGPTKDLIIRNNLGVVINPDENEFLSAVLEIYTRQIFYRKKIIDYIEHYKATPIEEIIESKL